MSISGQGISKRIRVHLLETINIYPEFHVNSSDSYYSSAWTRGFQTVRCFHPAGRDMRQQRYYMRWKRKKQEVVFWPTDLAQLVNIVNSSSRCDKQLMEAIKLL